MAPARTQEDGFDVSIPEVPVTEQRRPFIPEEGDQKLKDPGLVFETRNDVHQN